MHAQTRRLTVSYTQDGSSHEVEVEVPAIPEAASEQRADAARFVQTLVDNGNLDGPAATHRIVTRPDGTRALQALRKS